MASNPSHSVLDTLAATTGEDWPMIRKAREEAFRVKRRLAFGLTELVSREDMSVVVFGSLARNEVTSGSDIDWTLLLDGQASSRHFDVSRQVSNAIDQIGRNGPGREATFGGFAISHDILHQIGGGEDTNRNLTQRILLLLESEALGPGEAHDRVLRGVLHRYITEDAGWDAKTVTVPRFLLNDIARYWRTVAVDFAYKRRERSAQGFALRTVKLRLSRKLTYASGLLACFSCGLESVATEGEDRSRAVIDHLLGQVRFTPLERIAHALLREQLLGPAARLLGSYNRFLEILDDETGRRRLDRLSPDEAQADAAYEEARDIGRDFQDALNDIFFGDDSPRIATLTRKYGVF